MNKKISFYIHIPFCVSKCYYCSFNSYPLKNFSDEIVKNYFESVLKHIEIYKDYNFTVKTIYFGGGTPSIVSSIYIEQILNFILKNFKISNNCEISIEVNPESCNEDKLKVYKNSGINRISIGVQSFNDKFLKILGRIHNSNQALKAIEFTKKYFNNVSIDLIFGILEQKVSDLELELGKIKEISPCHVSYYSLSVEENTKFFSTGVKEIDEVLFSEMYDLIVDSLNEIGIFQYEISNFSKNGFKCKHNLCYWNYEEYLGFGAGAVSFFNKKRWKNVIYPVRYIENFKLKEYEENIDKKTMEFEYIFLNLRKVDGLDLKDYEKRFGAFFLSKYKKTIEKLNNYFVTNNSKIALNKEGFKVSNLIFTEFLGG